VADARLCSGHFEEFSRRTEYRRTRRDLFAARGLLTLAGEQIRGWVGESADWPSLLPFRRDQLPGGAKYLLIDHQSGGYFPVKTGLNTIGRLPSNDIVLEETWISRRHCVLLAHATGGCELHDTASRNGTYINGRRVLEPTQLASGDWVQVCKRLLVFVDAEDEEADPQDDDHPSTALV